MFSLKTKSLALLGSLMLGASAVMAQDSATLLDLLVRKGIVTDQEAEDLRADLSKENTAAMVSTSKGPNLDKLVINGRFQAQFVSLGTDISGTAADPATNQHAFLRRIYVGFKPTFGNGWSAFLNYDFAGSTFDAAYIEWTKSPELFVDVGFKKAPIGYEEYFISSGALKSIERSPITRFFVESNNGRRLGAGSYRQGVWVGGKQSNGLSYEFAVTNPEREESSAGAAGVGSAANNNFAYWGTLGYAKSIGGGALKVGGSLGILPDQVASSGDGVWAPFLGRPAYTPTLTASLQHKTGAAAFFVAAERLSWGRGYHLHVFPVLDDLPANKAEAALRINQGVEAVVRRFPAQYLWSYNRHKRPGGAPPPDSPAAG